MITFDKKTLLHWKENQIHDVSIYFFESGCAGTKIRVEPGKSASCDIERNQEGLTLHLKKNEIDLIEGGKITQVGNKWIFQNSSINTRCGCGSSFSLKTDSPLQDKIARMKLAMKQKKEGVHK